MGRSERPRGRHRGFVSIRSKLVLVLLLATVPIVALLGFFTLGTTTGLLREQAVQGLQQSSMLQARTLSDAFGRVTSHAQHMARTVTVRAFAQACTDRRRPPADLQDRLQDEFAAMGELTKLYGEVAYVDRTGRERARVDFHGGLGRPVPEAELRPHTPVPQLPQIEALRADELYVSPLRLDREAGRVIQPAHPIMWCAAPVTTGNATLGVVVLRLEAGQLLPASPPGGSAFLADREGWYLAHTDSAKAWSGPDDLNTGYSLHRDLGDQASRLLVGLPAVAQAGGRLVATWPVTLGDTPRSPYVLVGVEEPERTLFAGLRAFRSFFWLLLGISSAAPVLAGLVLASFFLRPVQQLRQAVHAVAKGDLSVAARVHSGDEFEQLAGDFNAMAARLREYQQQERAALVGRMAERIIHDLKNPLSAVVAFARVLGDNRLTEDRRQEAADRAIAQVRRIEGMVREILDFSRGESPQLEKQRVPVGRLLEELEPDLGVTCSQQGIELRLGAAPVCDVEADLHYLQRALANITANAVEAMPEGGTLGVELECRDGGVQISVTDTGPGIPAEIAERLFEPFVTHGKPNGTGLGLASAKAIVEAHGGRIEVGSRRGAGATFRVWLPTSPEPAGAPAAPADFAI